MTAPSPLALIALPPNYAFERSARRHRERAASAQVHCAPAARCRPQWAAAQRGR